MGNVHVMLMHIHSRLPKYCHFVHVLLIGKHDARIHGIHYLTMHVDVYKPIHTTCHYDNLSSSNKFTLIEWCVYSRAIVMS